MANSLLNALANNPITGGVISLLERLEFGQDQVLRVITYHRVVDPARSPELYPRIMIHPDLFEQHMRFLSQRCRVVSMEEVLHAVRELRSTTLTRPTRVSYEPHAPSRQAEYAQPSDDILRHPEWVIPNTSGALIEPGQGAQSAGARPTGRSKASLPKRAVLITFDDATTDFTENALPVLQRYNLPATVFVPTAFPGNPQRPFWWDQLYNAVEHAYNLDIIQTPLGGLQVETPAQRHNTFSLLRDYVKSLPHLAALDWVDRFCAELEAPRLHGSVLSWDALRAVRAAGITLGAHTRNHPMLERIALEEARAEAVGSWQDLRRETGETMPVFAYPSGGYNRILVEILRQEGFELAFTTRRGINRLSNTDPLQMKRINAGPRTSVNMLRAQMLNL